MRTDLCGSCELVQRVRGAAQSTTARSSRLAPAGRARQLGGRPQCVPMPNGHRPQTSAIAIPKRPGNTPARALAAGTFVRRAARSVSAPRAQPGCTHALAHAAQGCTDSARHARSACLPSGTGARLGTGVRVARRAEQSAGAYPANRLRSRSRRGPGACSNSSARPIRAPLGDGLETAIACRFARGTEPAGGLLRARRRRDRLRTSEVPPSTWLGNRYGGAATQPNPTQPGTSPERRSPAAARPDKRARATAATAPLNRARLHAHASGRSSAAARPLRQRSASGDHRARGARR